MSGSHDFNPVHPIYRRLAILTEGTLDIYRNKTAMGLLRFRPEDVVCVIDSNHVGADLKQLCGIDAKVPVVGDIHAAIRLGVQWLVIGVNTPGGFLPNALRPQVYEAIRNRIGVLSGLHESVNGDPNLVALAARYAVELVNLRATPDERMVSTGKARSSKAFRLLTVGTDANIGKTMVALTLEKHLNKTKAYKIKTRFVSTSQDGILITGRGVAVDRMISDFAGGLVEKLVLHEDQYGADLLVIEGQNSICSPCYSGTALSLLHGSCPDAMVLCHNPSRLRFRHTDAPMPSLTTFIELYERILAPLHPGKVVAISLNTLEMDPASARAAIDAAEKETGLPVADPIREGEEGLQRIAAAVLKARATQRSFGRTAGSLEKVAAKKTAVRAKKAPAAVKVKTKAAPAAKKATKSPAKRLAAKAS